MIHRNHCLQNILNKASDIMIYCLSIVLKLMGLISVNTLCFSSFNSLEHKSLCK